MVAHAIETFGRLDYAVNNAGIEGRFAGITDMAVLNCGKGGAIVNVGSINSFLGSHPARRTSLQSTPCSD